jgi:hypothetical protein
MNIKKIFKTKNVKINPKKFFQFAFSCWRKNSNRIFIFSLIVFLGIGIYIWYKNVYKFQWSETRKLEYINSRNKSINLQEEKFKAVLTEIEKRRMNFNIEQNKSDLSANNAGKTPKSTGATESSLIKKGGATVNDNQSSTLTPVPVDTGGVANDKNNAPFQPIKDIFK